MYILSLMSFIKSRTSAKFYGESQMTFLVQKDCVDIIFKIKKGVYLTVSVYSLSESRLLLACSWDGFWNRLKQMRNRKDVLKRLGKTCPQAAKIFTQTDAPHFAHIDKELTIGVVVLEMKAPVVTNNVSDYLHEKVVEKAVELMHYNLNLFCELDEKCPFPAWKTDLKQMK